MNVDNPLRKRGRPLKTAAEKLRDRVWIHAVQLRSSLSTGYMLEKTIEPSRVKRKDGKISRPRKWDNYLNSDRGPGRIKGKQDSVLLAEAEFPGTAKWHRSPLWRSLEGKPMSAADCDAALRRLDQGVIDVLYTENPDAPGEGLKPRPFDPEVANQLFALGNFDALAAVVILVRLAEAIASPPLRDLSLSCYCSLQPAIAELPELKPFYEELFSMIDTRCKHWVFVSSNQRMEVVIFWQGVRDNVWPGSK
jgi:hypothetical protein